MRKISYTTIALQGPTATRTSSLSLINASFPNFYSKTHKIIIKLNNKSAARALNSQLPKNIQKSINQYMKTKIITDTDIQAAWKLKIGSIALYTANDNEIKKLLENNCQTKVLRRKTKLITKTFGIVAYAIRVDSINLAHKKITIEKNAQKIQFQFWAQRSSGLNGLPTSPQERKNNYQ